MKDARRVAAAEGVGIGSPKLPAAVILREETSQGVLGSMTVVLQDRRVGDRRRAAPDRARVVGVAVIAALSAADVITSSWLRGRSGVEVNPIAGWLIAHGALELAKLTAVGAVAILLHRARPWPWVMPAVWFVAGIYAAVISFHLLQLSATS
jgi:hypothetical protein